jgi:DNA-binding NarL/FixJ family response regulator
MEGHGMSSERRTNVLIVDGDAFVRAGLRALLHAEGDMRVVGEATSGREAIRQSARLGPDVVLLDAALPDGATAAVCRELRAQLPRTRVLILVDRADTRSVLTAVQAGADGCVSKTARLEEVRRVVRAVVAGEAGLDRRALEVLLDHVRRQPSPPGDGPAALTEVERRVLTLVAAGKTNKQIASDLALSEKSVKNRLGHAFGKLRVTRRAEAAVLFMTPPDGDSPDAA